MTNIVNQTNIVQVDDNILNSLLELHETILLSNKDFVVRHERNTFETFILKGMACMELDFDNGKPIVKAFGKVTLYTAKDGNKVAEVSSIMVRGNYLGQGLARKIILDCFEIVKRLNEKPDKIIAVMHKDNTASIALFNKIGGILYSEWPSNFREELDGPKVWTDLTHLVYQDVKINHEEA